MGGGGTYSVLITLTLSCALATIVAVEKQPVLPKLSVFICSLRYPTCNAHAPNCHLYNMFPHFLINDTIFEERLQITKCVF